jgi:hypothetical protein
MKREGTFSPGLHKLGRANDRALAPALGWIVGLKLERTLRDLVHQAYALTPAEIDLMWKTAPPRMPIPAPGA